MYAGATKSVYAPEPFDVGRYLQAEIVSNGQRITLATTGPIDPGSICVYIYSLLCRRNEGYNVFIAK